MCRRDVIQPQLFSSYLRSFHPSYFARYTLSGSIRRENSHITQESSLSFVILHTNFTLMDIPVIRANNAAEEAVAIQEIIYESSTYSCCYSRMYLFWTHMQSSGDEFEC